MIWGGAVRINEGPGDIAWQHRVAYVQGPRVTLIEIHSDFEGEAAEMNRAFHVLSWGGSVEDLSGVSFYYTKGKHFTLVRLQSLLSKARAKKEQLQA